MKKLDVDIRNHCMQHETHCGKCAELINTITSKGLSELGKNPYHCFYKSDNISKYLAQCVVEAYRDKQEYYKNQQLFLMESMITIMIDILEQMIMN